MSIFHNALKKIQHSMGKNPSPSNPFNIPNEEKVEILPSSSSSGTNNQTNPLTNLLIVILCLSMLVGSGLYIVSQIQKKNPQFLSKIKINTPLRLPKISFTKAKTNPPAKPLAQISLPPTNPPSPTPNKDQTLNTITPPNRAPTAAVVLNVQGVMASNNHNVVLINGNVYEEGNVINGVKILIINLDNITIEYAGKQEMIAVKK